VNGDVPRESPSGDLIYFQRQWDDGRLHLWSVPVAGGEEKRVLGPIQLFYYVAVEEGVYFVGPVDDGLGTSSGTPPPARLAPSRRLLPDRPPAWPSRPTVAPPSSPSVSRRKAAT
jgi:hypothetical protein